MSVIFSATPATSIIINTTAITGGTDTRVLFDDGGFIGEDAGFTYTKTTRALAITSGSVSITSTNIAPLTLTYSVTGTNTTRGIRIEPTWNTSGYSPALEIVVTDTSSPSDNYLLRVGTTGDTDKFIMLKNGQFQAPHLTATTGNVNVGSDAYFNWSGRSNFQAPTNGNLLMQNNAGGDFGLLQWGGTSSGYPALKRASAVLEHKLADDSAYGDAKALHFITTATDFMCKTVGTLANGAGVATGTLLNAPAAGNPTKWVPIDDNGTTRYVPAW